MTDFLGNDVRAIVDALDEPALIIRNGKVVGSNQAANALLGNIRPGSDVRLAIRHPQVLELILPAVAGRVEVSGLGDFDRSWTVTVSILDTETVLVRLIDRTPALAAERMRVDFVANASHELRTPLATIIGYSETLSGEEPLQDDLRVKFGQTVHSEAKRMLRIVEDLMSLSRIVADKFVPPAMEANLGEVVKSALSNLSRTFESRLSEIVVEVQEDLPPIQGDIAQLEQVVENLVSNALRYGGEGSGRISVQASGGMVTLVVADTGPGIAREHLPRLTERFYRVDPARSRQSGGTGLGLAIVKHIVERHRGSLRIDSELGAGTSVTISLPVASARL